jgi:hypothetical protein
MHEPFAQEDAALVFTGEQYLFRWKQGEATHAKFVSPAAVRAAFSNVPIDSGWMPPEGRRWGTGPNGAWTIMHIPPMRHALTFTGIVEGEPQTTRTIPLPGLVFVHFSLTGYVWALRGDFSPEALLYHAPLPNVGSGGAICFGSNRTEGLTAAQTWQLFLTSPFNDHSTDGKSRQQPDDVRLLLMSLARHKRYPVDDLAPLNPPSTVDQIADALNRPKYHEGE